MKLGAVVLAMSMVSMTACGKGSNGGAAADAPRLTQMPPGAEGLVLGASTEAQVAAKLPGAEVSKDKSLGGDMIVQVDEHPAENLRSGTTTASLWKAASGKLVLMHLEMHGAGLCDWTAKTVASMKGDTACGGNRKVERGEVLACAASADGALRLEIDCTPVAAGDELRLSARD